MKVLWITNTLFPDVCQHLGVEPPILGGWMFSALGGMIDHNKELNFGVASLYSGKNFQELTINNVTYFLLPKKNMNNLEFFWSKVNDSFAPDITHIHGSEYPHGLAYVNSCDGGKVVVSIQGLVSIYERYYLGGISKFVIKINYTLRDILLFDSVLKAKKNMAKRGIYERELFRRVKYVIGRTKWDAAHVWAINPKIKYEFCNETLRPNFYNHLWEIDKCEKYSIFLSQGYYPIKGFHMILNALPLILRHFPETKIYISGKNFVTGRAIKLTGYGRLIKNIISKSNLESNVVFTGLLNESKMIERYTKSHIFLCPSSIENSPNSVGEAQLLGVPCVASYVGGISDMVENNVSGVIYRFEEIEMLAKSICELFASDSFCQKISRGGRKAALIRHDKETNSEQLFAIYNKIFND